MEAKELNSVSSTEELDLLWNPEDAAASEAAFRALLLNAEAPLETERYASIEPLTWIARAEALQGKFVESRTSLDQAEKLLLETEAVYPISVKIRWLLESGRLYVLERTPSRAQSLFSAAWKLANHSGEDSLAVEIAQLIAASESPKAQQEWILRAITIAESSPIQKTKKWLGSLHSTLGWKLFDLRQYEKALEEFQKALRNFKAYGTRREAFVAQWSIGKVLRTLGKTEEALTIQKGLLSELDLQGQRDGRLYEELAECLQTLKRTTEAQSYFEWAYKELCSDVWITDNEPLKLKRMKDLGKVK